MSESLFRHYPVSLKRLREIAEANEDVMVKHGILTDLVEAVSVAKWHILGEYAPGISVPSAADYEALRIALAPFEMERRGDRP